MDDDAKAVEAPAKTASEDGDAIEASATPVVEEIKPASISEEGKDNITAEAMDDDKDNKSHATIAADSTEINLKEDAESEKNNDKDSEERIKSTTDSAEIKPPDDSDTKDNGAFPDEPTDINVSVDIEPKDNADTHDDHPNDEVQKEADADASSVVKPSLEESEQTKSLAEVAAKSSPVLPPIFGNTIVEEREQVAASALVGSPQASAKSPPEQANQTDAAAETAPVDAVPSSSPVPPISPLGSPLLRPNGTGMKKKEIGLSDFFSSQNNELPIVGDLLTKAARPINKDCGLDDDDDGDDDDSVDSSARGIRSEMLRNNFDDSSVAQMAETLEQQPISSRLSETWTKGDTIQNWSGWANQVITASDTASVAGFEASMDLRDEGDFDDESTIATFMDDNTIASATPGYNNTLYGDVAQTPGRVGQSISFEMPAITPAKVAASILFSDSPTTSVETTQQTTNAHRGGRGTADIVLDAGLSFPHDLGLDAGLSFGGNHLDLDDGLGFGGVGGLSDFGGSPVQEDDKNPDKKKWFAWN